MDGVKINGRMYEHTSIAISCGGVKIKDIASIDYGTEEERVAKLEPWNKLSVADLTFPLENWRRFDLFMTILHWGGQSSNYARRRIESNRRRCNRSERQPKRGRWC